MKKPLFNKLFEVGVRKEQPDYLKRSITLTNQLLYLAVFAVALPFLVLTKIHFEPILFVPIAGIGFATFAYLLNFVGLYNVSRLIFSILPVTLVSTYNASVSAYGEEPVAASAMLSLSFTFIPFVIFGLKEKLFLTVTVLYSFILIMVFDFHNELFDIPVDGTVIRIGYLRYVTTAMACIIGFGTMYGLISINRKAEKKAEALIQEMGENNDLLNQSQDDLENKLNELEVAREEEKKRNWASEGLAKLGDILRSDKDLSNLSDNVLSTLVKYVNANQGGLYSVLGNDKETYIKLVSSYAYDQKKYDEKRIEIGQGLLGQTYKEKSYKYLTEVPQGYMEITSGLGEATPGYLLIVPMMVNDKVEGLIELASFYEIEQYKIDFVEKLGEQLASSLSAKNIEENTKTLLDETRIQTQEMQEQEEIMRQSMEELQAIQEDMNRAHLDNLAQTTALNNAALVSETDRKGYITYVNDTFCKFSEYSRDELLGKNHNIIRHPDMPKEVFKDMWATIGKGEIWNGRVKNRKKSGGFYWVQASITPVMGKEGKPEKYVGVRFDITDEVLREEAYLKKINVLEAAV